MSTEKEIKARLERFEALKMDYFQKIKAYRMVVAKPDAFSEQTMLSLLNSAEKAYKRIGLDIGDDGMKGYP